MKPRRKAVITSNRDNNTVKLMCGEAWSAATVNGAAAETAVDENGRKYITVTLNKNETAEIKFTLNEIANGTYHIRLTDGYLNVESYAEGAAAVTTAEPEKWNVTLNGDGTYTIINTYSGRRLTDTGIYRSSDYTWSDVSAFAFENQKTETAGCCADEIEISSAADLNGELTAGKTVKFEVAKYVPGAAVAYGARWSVTARN